MEAGFDEITAEDVDELIINDRDGFTNEEFDSQGFKEKPTVTLKKMSEYFKKTSVYFKKMCEYF